MNRYDLRNTSLGYEPCYEMVEDTDGEWVRFEDAESWGSKKVQSLIDEREQLRGNLSLAEEGLANATQEIQLLRDQRDSNLAKEVELVQRLNAENERLRKINAGMIQGLKDADAEARGAHEPNAAPPHCPTCLCGIGHCPKHPAAIFHPPAACPECASGLLIGTYAHDK